jgi:predicted site-specific integrase-resolvase
MIVFMNTEKPLKIFLTREEAAEMYRVSTRTLQRWEQRGLVAQQAVARGKVTYHRTQIELFLRRRNKVVDISQFARPR